MDVHDAAAGQQLIHVAAGEYVVQVHPHELPDDARDMLTLLIAETAPLATWIDVAKAYLAQGKAQPYEAVLQCDRSRMHTAQLTSTRDQPGPCPASEPWEA